MTKLNVLHICNWFPNTWNPNEAPFILRHIKSLDSHCNNTIWHVNVKQVNKKWRFIRKNDFADRTYIAHVRLRHWWLIEWASFFLILWAWWTRNRAIKYDIVNFHIGYPNCVRISLLHRLICYPFIITEHWSAYHRKFNTSSSGVDRIKNIFHQNIPIIVVSKALEKDINEFAGPPQPRFHVLDNAVDPEIFFHDPSIIPKEGVFFTIAGWKPPKRTDLVLESLVRIRELGWNARLRMAGSASRSIETQKRIEQLGLSDHVDLLGQLDERAIATELREAHAMLHASDYETYSVITAEALCCGTPVVASARGAIPEFVLPGMGLLQDKNDPTAWTRSLTRAWHKLLKMDRNWISDTMTKRASINRIGERYIAILEELVEADKNKK